MALKLPKMAQKLAPAKKNSRDISPVSPTFCISVFPPSMTGHHQHCSYKPALLIITVGFKAPGLHMLDLSGDVFRHQNLHDNADYH